MKKRSVKKIAIVSTSIGLVALTPVCPAATLSVVGAALWSVPAFVYGSNVKKECEKNADIKKYVFKK